MPANSTKSGSGQPDPDIQLPQRALERLQQTRESGGRRLFTSDLSVNEFLLVKEAGFDPAICPSGWPNRKVRSGTMPRLAAAAADSSGRRRRNSARRPGWLFSPSVTATSTMSMPDATSSGRRAARTEYLVVGVRGYHDAPVCRWGGHPPRPHLAELRTGLPLPTRACRLRPGEASRVLDGPWVTQAATGVDRSSRGRVHRGAVVCRRSGRRPGPRGRRRGQAGRAPGPDRLGP